VAEIFKLFSNSEAIPTTHSYESANRLLPIVKKYTEEAYQESEKLAAKLAYFQKNSAQYKAVAQQYDTLVARWVERVRRVGALAKGLWLVDFDTGNGYLCWVYPEERVEYFHTYETGFKARVKVCDLEHPLPGLRIPSTPQPPQLSV